MLIAGIVLLVAAVGLIVAHVMARRRTGYLLAAHDRTAQSLIDTAATVASEVGAGGFTEFVTLQGRPEVGQPLISPLAEQPCLYYRMTIRREYEEEYEERDSEGRTHQRTRRGSDTMSTEEQHLDFMLAGDGAMPVRLDGADFDGLVETMDRFVPGGGLGASITVGRFQMTVSHAGMGRRTLGFKYHEEILPMGRPLTVIGQASDAPGVLSMGRGGLAFIVSLRTKREMLGSAKKQAGVTAALSGICALAGIGLTIAGALSG